MSHNLSGKVWTDHSVLKQFPFNIGDTLGVSENSRILHWHDEMEICYVKQGTGKYLIDGCVYEFSKGDVFIINNDQIHLAYDDTDMVMQVTMFQPSIIWPGGMYVMDYDYLKPFLEADTSFCNKLDHNHPHIGKVVDILMEIEDEFINKTDGYKLMIKSLLLKLMTTIIRYFKQDAQEESGQKVSGINAQKLKCVLEYIEHSYSQQLKLSDLARISGMSVSHFCHLFKELTGIAPMDYILRRRISASKEMLKNCDSKILEVASECGFNSLSNFNKFFKIFTGLSPRQYRGM